jgi:uncharacterized protein
MWRHGLNGGSHPRSRHVGAHKLATHAAVFLAPQIFTRSAIIVNDFAGSALGISFAILRCPKDHGFGAFCTNRLASRRRPKGRRFNRATHRRQAIRSIMLRLSEIKLPLDHPPEAIAQAAIARLGIPARNLLSCTVFRRAHDARKKSAILLIYTLDIEARDEAAILKRFAKDLHVNPTPDTEYRFVAHAPQRPAMRPIVIGAGPCGLFAALLLAQMGFRPIILERGRVVRERTKDTWMLWRKSVLNPESNVQYGEGGAGTFSDGKLYSQIKDPRHLGRKVLTEFVKAEAPAEILTEAHPHIGTFRLVKMVENMRRTIESLGGEYRFESRVTDLAIETGHNGARQIRGVVLASGEHIAADQVVLAVGHSARDTFQMLHDRGVYVEAKPFSIGFRIEHPQSLIDTARFGPCAGNPILGAADYKLVHHASNGRDVYSFCMCPGGTVVAATSEPNRVVTNGMSQYSRAERNANAGIVVGITPEDYPGGPLAGIAFQRSMGMRRIPRRHAAPAQLVEDLSPPAPAPRWVTLSRRINPESRRRISPRASPITPSPRSAKRYRHSAARYTASTWRMPCSQAWKPTPLPHPH